MGFQIKKNWDVNIKNITNKICNNQIVNRINNDLLCIIIKILRILHALESYLENSNYFIQTQNTLTDFKIISGEELNPIENKSLPNRLILLKKMDEEKGIVVDFGDFYKYRSNNLLNIYKINDEAVEELSSIIHGLIIALTEWMTSTGFKFILDPTNFRIMQKKGKVTTNNIEI